jgi:hypothetical protein
MRYLVLNSLLLLSACAPMSESACRSANWREMGERDGLGGGPPRIDTYAYQCAQHQVEASQGDYMEGWRVGNALHHDRVELDSPM